MLSNPHNNPKKWLRRNPPGGERVTEGTRDPEKVDTFGDGWGD